ncbi:GntR family transcriptional regulator [Actinokineospora sp. PR83]|uniref:GntR family transcriptional regulator n=1 Tax=Actinokineospora sp. PR83 TaxID=2884908 RepID=UPI001F2D0269|nr:GntR family transcriptional regulator [Actinokineospora sp. PR83]MCG8917700.1 GntR family transcriptional regulator [Actinokineospora sp. PR83]
MTGYAEIAAHFRSRIASGALAPGQRLPTLREVMAEFEVAQQTASRAYKVLRAEGLTDAATGSGTVVADPTSAISARVRGWAATGRALSANESSEIVEIGTVSADEPIAARLDIEPGSPVFVRRRVVSRDGVPAHLTSSYYPAEVVEATPELAVATSTGGSRELAAERLGSAQDRVLEEVTSRLATDDEKSQLGLTGSGPTVVTQVTRSVWLADGRIVEVAVKVCPGATVLRWSTPLT